MNNKVLTLDEAIALHKGNAKFYKETGEDIQRQNEENLALWLSVTKEVMNAVEQQLMEELLKPPYFVQTPIVYKHYATLDTLVGNAVVKLSEDSDKDKR